MESLEVGGNEYDQSVAFDGTKKDGTMVTVGAKVTREQEAKLLNICCDAQGDGYKPFATKSRGLDPDQVPIKNLIKRFPGKIAVSLCPENPDKVIQAEAAQSADLYNKITRPESAVVAIADGDKKHARLLGKGIKSLSNAEKPVVACQKSEFYYPHSYFADLLANFIARNYNRKDKFPQRAFEVVVVSNTESSCFWEAHNKIGSERYEYEVPKYKQKQADKSSTRALSWFNGEFGGNSPNDQLQTDSTQPIRNWLSNNGYSTAANSI